jgi:hypothetical protein
VKMGLPAEKTDINLYTLCKQNLRLLIQLGITVCKLITVYLLQIVCDSVAKLVNCRLVLDVIPNSVWTKLVVIYISPLR